MEQKSKDKFIFIQIDSLGHRFNGIILYYKVYNKYHRLSELPEKDGCFGESKRKCESINICTKFSLFD